MGWSSVAYVAASLGTALPERVYSNSDMVELGVGEKGVNSAADVVGVAVFVVVVVEWEQDILDWAIGRNGRSSCGLVRARWRSMGMSK